MWGWGDTSVIGLLVATGVLLVIWVVVENRSDSPLVDMKMMRIPAVWSTNLAALLFGFGMFAMFVTLPQFTETPTHAGYGFGASVTQSGLYLAPFAAAMVIVAPMTGRLSKAFGSKKVLVVGSLITASSYLLLILDHTDQWSIYVATGLLGIGIALGFASMANLIIEAVPAEQTGVATGMNTNIRNIGAALGSGIATSLVVSGLAPGGFPKEHGYMLAFAVSGLALVVAALAALAIPKRTRPPSSNASRTPRSPRRPRSSSAPSPSVPRTWHDTAQGAAPPRTAAATDGAAAAAAGRRGQPEPHSDRCPRRLRRARATRPPWRRSPCGPTSGSGTLYRRFPNKADLLDAVVEAAHVRKRQIAEAVLADVAPEEGVFEFVRRCIAVPSCWRATISAPPWRTSGTGLGQTAPLLQEILERSQRPGRSVPTSRWPTSSWSSWPCAPSPTSATRSPPSRHCASWSSCSTACVPGTTRRPTTRSPSPSSTGFCATADVAVAEPTTPISGRAQPHRDPAAPGSSPSAPRPTTTSER